MHLENIWEWLLKCFFYFLPILFMVLRYNSFLIDKKRTPSDIIVDGDFCIIPFCFALDSIIDFLRKAGMVETGLKPYGIACCVILSAAALLLLLLYWDLSYYKIQKKGKGLGGRKKKMEKQILALTGFVIAASLFSGML